MATQGISDIADVPSIDLAPFVERGQIQATTDYRVLSELETVNICVPTPLRKSKDPDMSFIISAVEGGGKYFHRGQLIILESTTYPGTTEEIVLPKLEENGLKVGEDLYLAFSPDRIDPGNETYSTANTPKIDIDYECLVKHAAIVVDTRSATKSVESDREKIIKI